MSPRVAVAAVSREAARAGARVAAEGGTAVDAALSAGLTAAVTHPGMCSLAGAAFVTVWPADGDPVLVDGGAGTPGRGLDPEQRGQSGIEVHLGYGGGLDTVVGAGSVATPGLLAACAAAADRFGRLPWRVLLEPAVEQTREGFPLPEACHDFLTHAHEPIYARDPRSRAALEGRDGGLAGPGETVRPEGLADSLEALAREGVDLFYRGEIGRRIARHVRDRGGSLTRRDLEAYRPLLRAPVGAELDGWRVATNPAPALGGRVLTALLRLSDRRPRDGWTAQEVRWLVRVQELVLGHREPDGALPDGVERLLGEAAGTGGASSSTLHTSAVDADGTICSVTMSDGYGSGVMPPGTGIWLNNCLGERALNPGGLAGRPPGRRIPSHMAPTAARGPGGEAMAVGTPGAARIPTVTHQLLLNRIRLGMTLEESVRHPRLHVEDRPDRPRVACEPGLPVRAVERPVRRFEELSMFFGGAGVAVRGAGGALEATADPRRGGGTVLR